MVQQAWRTLDIAGLTPAIELRRAEGVFIINGANYAWDSKGPKSCFGNRLLSSTAFAAPDHFQGVRIHTSESDRVFYFTNTQIVEWQETTLTYVVIYTFASTAAEPHRWTFGYLNGKIYFCHPGPGIIVLDVLTNIAIPLAGPGVPIQAFAICIDNGRLCAIDIDFLYWSAQSNGSNFEPKLSGPGFQKINERIAGKPIMISSFGLGILVWTTGGVMRSEFTGDAEVYRHRGINTQLRPINSFCVVTLDDDTVIILDERGLFKSKGSAPEPLAPLFSEFLKGYIQKYNLNEGINIRLEWDAIKQFLYVSVSTSFAFSYYERAFVLYLQLDKWGSFDEIHYGIVPAKITVSQRADDFFGYVGSDSRLRYFLDTGSRHDSNGNLIPLNAHIQVGLIRFTELQDAMDQMTEVQQLAIGNILSGDPDVLVEDYELIPEGQDEDYEIAVGAEDFGVERANYINHKLRILGTKDGVSVFDESVPQLTIFTKAIRHYSCVCVGIWHILEVKADEVGEAFHLQMFELTATYAGRIS